MSAFIKQFGIDIPSTEILNSSKNFTALKQLPTDVSYLFPSNGVKAGELLEKLSTGDVFSQVKWAQVDKNNIVADGIQQDVLILDYSTREPLEGIKKLSSQELPASAIDESAYNHTQEFKVTLIASPGRDGKEETVILDVTPRVSESRSISYSDFTPMHHPGQIQKYTSTQSRSWTVSGKLISRSSVEASRNLEIINIIRSWAMPFYGQGTLQDPTYSKYLGAPPPIITLSAYGDQMIGPVKTVLTQYSWEFPTDVDYIPTLDNTPFPVIFDVTLNLTETWSPAEFSGFDLNAFKRGNMQQSFKAIDRASVEMPKQQAAQVEVMKDAMAEPKTLAPSVPSKSQTLSLAKDKLVGGLGQKAAALEGGANSAVAKIKNGIDFNGVF